MIDEDAIKRGADALQAALPILPTHQIGLSIEEPVRYLPREWFEKITRVVLEAVEPNTIKVGDRVSWRYDNKQREYGTVIRISPRRKLYQVNRDDNYDLVVAARFITKEVG